MSDIFEVDRLTSPSGKVIFEWAEDKRVIIARLVSNEPHEIDFFAGIWLEIINGWEAGKPYLVMIDSRRIPSTGLTPYFRQKIQELVEATHDGLVGRSATIHNKAPILLLTRLVIEAFVNRRLGDHLPTKLFFDEEDAIEWLLGAYD